MTLNITVLHSECIYVAADFALMNWGAATPLIESSMKVVQFGYDNGATGLITYTGIGKADQKYTAEFVCEWLRGREDLDLPDLAELLRSEGTRWLAGLAKRTTRSPIPPKHTFVVAGYDREGAATLFVVSNFQGTHMRSLSDAASVLTTTSVGSSRSAHVLVTGIPGVVSRETRKLLGRTVDTWPLDSSRIKNVMLGLIEKASHSPEGRGGISSSGGAISLLPGGSAHQTLSEPSTIDLYHVSNGMVLPGAKELLASLGLPPGWALVGGTSVQGSSAPVHQDSCSRTVTGPSGGSPYELIDLGGMGAGRHSCVSIDDQARALGTSSDEREVGAVHYWIRQDDGQRLEVPLGNPSYTAMGGLDALGHAFLSVGGHHYGVPHVTRWDGEGFRDLDSQEGLPSGVVAVSPTGWVAGYVEVSPDVTRSDRRQAARWDMEGQLHVAPNANPGFDGTAQGVSADGTALLAHTSLGAPWRSAIWLPDGSVEPLPDVPGTELLVVGISDEQVIAAVAQSAAGRRAMTRKPGEPWIELGLPLGWTPTKVAHVGSILGTVHVEGFMQGWVLGDSGGSVRLPGYRFHHCVPAAANARGDIVGTASADHCSHALLWRLKP